MKKILISLFALTFVVASVTVNAEAIQAQEKRGLFGKLFGRKKTPIEVKKATVNKKRRATTHNKSRARSANRTQAAVPRAKPEVEKSENAKRLLIIGDFIAGHLADGLRAFYADDPNIVVVKQIEAASGLVRDDHYNWPGQIAPVITEQRPDMIIVALGANDRQTLRVGSQTIEYGSDDWSTHYRRRIGMLTDKLTQDDKTRAWAWLGLPAFEKASLNEAALAFNVFYEEGAAKREGRFIDIWRGFVDDKGKFSFSGHDVNGQIARLRSADGINFTPAGRAKLAFYTNEVVQSFLQQPIIAVPEEELSLDLEQTYPPPEVKSETQSPPPVRPITYVPPRKLWDAPESEVELIQSAIPASSFVLPLRSLAPQPGRVDYFLAD